MNTEKFHVFFRRVSTAGQDLSMQSSADALYRDKLFIDKIIIIDENAVSANKKSISERPEIQKVISLIKQDKAHTLYTFDRTRFYRDHYENMDFIELCFKHHIQIVYTSQGNGSIQATKDIFVEGFFSMYSDIEGKNIARRTAEARKRYPGQKTGYMKDKETKKYRKDPVKKELVEQFFTSLLEISTINEFGEHLEHFRKIFKCEDERLINIARDPFYAGFDLSNGENKLHHVEPYLDLETFNRIQQSKTKIIDDYLGRLEHLETQNAYKPLCGLCQRPLHYKIDKINNNGFYTCSNKHKKLLITVVDLAKVIQLVLHEVITNLNSKE